MPPKKKRRTPPRRQLHLPHILLLIDTAGAVGRGIVAGIGRYAAENGPWSVQCEYRALDSQPPKWLKDWRGDGIISRTVNSKQTRMIQESKLPFVELIDDPNSGLCELHFDYRDEATKTVSYFLECGIENFGYFAYGQTGWSKPHRDAHCAILRERGYHCHIYPAPNFRNGLPVWDELQAKRVAQWLLGLPRPIGIVVPGDLHAACLLEICRRLQVAVPEEVAILGRGNDPVICETVRPTLSSVDLAASRTGYEAAKLLDEKMAGIKSEKTILLSPSHIAVRQSTDLMLIEDAEVVNALRLIRDHACRGIDVAEVAYQTGLSRRTLERRFQRQFGRNVFSEIVRVRIERAKMLLANTDASLEAVGKKSGFNFPEYFSKAFRREVGMSPKEYRRMRQIPCNAYGT